MRSTVLRWLSSKLSSLRSAFNGGGPVHTDRAPCGLASGATVAAADRLRHR
jgi:hypothetical protein